MTDKKQEGDQQRKQWLEPYKGQHLPLLEKHLHLYKKMLHVQPQNACMPANYENYQKQYNNFVCKSSDVWVASFPKSGTTWCQELAWSVYHGLQHPDIGKLLTDRVPFFEWDCLFPDDATLDHLPDDDLNKTGVMWNLLQTASPPRFIKTHLQQCLLPTDVAKVGSKILYVCRDPKDVCVSLFYHSVKLDGFTGTFDDMVDLFLADVYPWAPFWGNVLGFWDIRNDPNVMFITYEQLKQDLRGNISKVAQFLGVQRPGLKPGCIDDKELDQLTEHCTFGSMSKNPATNNEALFAVGTDKSDKEKGSKDVLFMRKGQVGDHKKHLSSDQIQRFKIWTDKWLKNSDFPYYRN